MDAIDRLREAARNEATCIELSRQNKELRARVARLEDALTPFAHEAYDYDPDEGDDNQTAFDTSIKIGQLRTARRALEEK